VAEIKLFSGRANPELAREIVDYLGEPLGEIDAYEFSDGEIGVQILENVRGRDVFIIQPTCSPVNRHLMELLIMIDAFKRASANANWMHRVAPRPSGCVSVMRYASAVEP